MNRKITSNKEEEKKMKKALFFCGIMLITGLFLAGCGILPDRNTGSVAGPDLGIYDQSVAEDQLVTLEIAGGLKVTRFNGTDVSWAQNGSVPGEGRGSTWRAMFAGSSYKTIIKIPAGNHVLHGNLYLWDYNNYPGYNPGRSSYIRADGLVINHNFLPGRTYFLRPVLINRRGNEIVDYANSGPRGIQAVRLRIDENRTPVAQGQNVTR